MVCASCTCKINETFFHDKVRRGGSVYYTIRMRSEIPEGVPLHVQCGNEEMAAACPLAREALQRLHSSWIRKDKSEEAQNGS